MISPKSAVEISLDDFPFMNAESSMSFMMFSFVLEETGSFLPLRKRPEKFVQFYPQREGIDGFFIARMHRRK